MIRKLSIRTKITLWFSIALILIVGLTYAAVLTVSDQVIQKTIRDNLIETVEHNVDEVEYYTSLDQFNLATEVDHFMQYKDGYLEVDDDFLDEVNQIYTCLYMEDGTFLYGENPIAGHVGDLPFADSKIQRVPVHGKLYYVFDRKLTAEPLEGLWLRGVVSEEQGENQMASIVHTSLILLPTLVLITIVGGYLLAGRMLRPIQDISESALFISQGGDLKKRIPLGKGKDELYQLASNFNDMFERLDASFQMERQFTSDASHELRTPMAVILAQCELSLEMDSTPEEYRESLQVIDRQGKKMSKLINEMLDFTRLELKSDQYEKEKVNLTELVTSVGEDMKLLREKNISLEVNAEDEIYCNGNYGLLTRLLTNLISNAYHYGKEEGHIFVSLSKDKGRIRLLVEDDGIGMEEEEREKIFDRFYRADHSRSYGGTGLGLAMVKEIVHFHKGRIYVESELGKGSTFIVEFEAD